MTTYFVQAYDEQAGVVRSLKTDDYGEVADFAEVANDEGLEVREPWADLTTETQREFGYDGYGVSTVRKLIDMSEAQKRGDATESLA